jgi:hypothetical protein
VAAQLAVSQEGLSSMKLFLFLLKAGNELYGKTVL